MKKKFAATLLTVVLALGLCACAQSAAATWQEQYDLGVRYLSEGNYKEAVLAFSAAIDIDPKKADAYIGLADAYVAQGDTELAVQVLADALSVVADADVIRSRLDGLEGGAALASTPGTTAGPAEGLEPTPEPMPEPPTEEDLSAYIGLTRSEADWNDHFVTEPITLYYAFDERESLDGYSVLSQDTQLTVSNLANADDDCFVTVLIYICHKDQNGRYEVGFMGSKEGSWFLMSSGAFKGLIPPEDSQVMLRPGESATFLLSPSQFEAEAPDADLFILSPVLVYPETGVWSVYYGFVYG